MSDIHGVNVDGTAYGLDSDTAEARVDALQTYLVTALGQLKTALEESDIQGGVAVLDQAILDLSTLA